MHTAYLLLGSNVGDRNHHLQHAIEKISDQAGAIIKMSSVYETQPWGVTQQDDYLNLAVQTETRLSALELFKILQQIEASEGRVNPIKNTPRTLDIDILFFDDTVIDEGSLIIPHPRLHLRRFVLEPLSEIAPFFVHPTLNKSVEELLKVCTDEMKVKKV
ncbi:MAG: 2-amino-4-hydroxy-6-hydroxymethyldihydropteridine diphosphokinase [Chitinophagaceae bacterium]|nr:2-amino-4-hydroxy-6-hydroxymethyldihydropteridine diphosphokinase [Chitinophagaceae bacterium]